MRILITLPLLAVGCTGGYKYSGYRISDYFPLDGERSWTYSQDDETVEWRMQVDKVSETSMVGNTEVVTFEHLNAETGDLLYSVKWSSDASQGIAIHGYSVEATGESADYSTPIGVSDYQMLTGETVESTVNGVDYLSTFVAVEDCPNHWVDSWQCLKFTIEDDEDGNGIFDDDDDDDAGSPPFTGTYWLAPRYGASRFEPNGYTDAWVLTRADWSAE